MNKKNIAKIAVLAGLIVWVAGIYLAKQGKRELRNAFPAGLLASSKTCVTPQWPLEARRYEIEGVSLLHFRIGEDGSVQDAQVARSSSWKVLDDAAIASLVNCRFKPGLDEARDKVTFPIQFVWTMTGKPPMRPAVVAGSCAPSRTFSSFKTFERAPTGDDGVLVRLLVGPDGKPFGVKAEGASPKAAQEALAYVQSCSFAVDAALAGQQTDTTFGRALYRAQ